MSNVGGPQATGPVLQPASVFLPAISSNGNLKSKSGTFKFLNLSEKPLAKFITSLIPPLEVAVGPSHKLHSVVLGQPGFCSHSNNDKTSPIISKESPGAILVTSPNIPSRAPNISARLLSRALAICPNIAPIIFSLAQAGTLTALFTISIKYPSSIPVKPSAKFLKRHPNSSLTFSISSLRSCLALGILL